MGTEFDYTVAIRIRRDTARTLCFRYMHCEIMVFEGPEPHGGEDLAPPTEK